MVGVASFKCTISNRSKEFKFNTSTAIKYLMYVVHGIDQCFDPSGEEVETCWGQHWTLYFLFIDPRAIPSVQQQSVSRQSLEPHSITTIPSSFSKCSSCSSCSSSGAMQFIASPSCSFFGAAMQSTVNPSSRSFFDATMQELLFHKCCLTELYDYK